MDKKELEIGTKIEKEHQGTIKKIIQDVKSGQVKPFEEYFKNIAKEHIKEFKDYYTRLVKMENEARKELSKSDRAGLTYALKMAETAYEIAKQCGDVESMEYEKSEIEYCKQQFEKSLDSKIDSFYKAIHHKDSNTFTDTTSMNLAKLATPQSYQDYVMGFVHGLEPGNPVEVPLKENKKMKIYKVEDGIYSGHIEDDDGTITHHIDRVTVPEIVSHLVSKELQPLEEQVEEIKEKEETQTKQIVININVSKSKESEMNTLDGKIEAFYKGTSDQEEKKPLDKEVQGTEKTEQEMADEEEKKKESRRGLISEMIDSARKHHDKNSDHNVKDISKFLVHLHKDPEEEGVEGQKKTTMKKSLPEKKSFDDFVVNMLKAEKSPTEIDWDKEKKLETLKKVEKKVKKSLDDQINDLSKANGDDVKLTKDENKMIFDMTLKDLIESSYLVCKKKHPNLSDEQRMKKIKDKVMEQVARKMTYDPRFVLAKRAVSFDEKYLNEFMKKIDFEELDNMYSDSMKNEPMYYSEEGYKIFAEKRGISRPVVEALEKGNNFFSQPIQSPKFVVAEIKEFDYEGLSKGKVEKKTDKLFKAAIEQKIRNK